MYNFGMQNQMQNPMGFNPYEMTQRYPQTQNSLIRVTGIDGAKAYQMNPNSTVALFDNNEDLFYVKSTDGAGFPTIRTFSFKETDNAQPVVNPEYASKEELNTFKKEIVDYVKQFVQKSATKQVEPVNAISKSTETES